MKNILDSVRRFIYENGPVIALSLLFLGYYYGPFILHPNSFLFCATGDGLKNYYTFAWYVQHNAFSTDFTGMNYPYGEHFLYTDCHPLLAVILKVLSEIHPFFATSCIAILNAILLLAPLLTSLVLFRIFRYLGIEKTLGTAGAVGLMLLSPQTYRLTGHLALSYSVCIPLTIYFIVKYFLSGFEKKWLGCMICQTIMWFLVHAYLGMISLFISCGVAFLMLFQQSQRKPGLALLLSGVFAFLSFYLFIFLTDSHVGRTNNPWGIYELHASFPSIFTPNRGWLSHWMRTYYPEITPSIEGLSYIGILSILGIPMLLAFIVRKMPDRKWHWLSILDSHPVLKNLLAVGVLMLLFSMLFPFWNSLEKYVEYFRFIKQFRAIGRFAWAFYFIIGVLTVYTVHQLLLRKHAAPWLSKMVAPLVFLCVPAWESIDYHLEIQSNASKYSNVLQFNNLNAEQKQAISHINPNQFQAIIPIPFYYIGSDNFGKTAHESIYFLSTVFSYHLRIPLMTAFLSRTGIQESKNFMQITAENYYPKKLKNDILATRPFLVVASPRGQKDSDIAFLEKCTPLFQSDSVQIFSISVEQLFQDQRQEAWNEYARQLTNSSIPNDFIVEDFESGTAKGFVSSKALEVEGGTYSRLYNIQANALRANTEYVASFWLSHEGPNYGQDQLSGFCFIEKSMDGNKNWVTGAISPTNGHAMFHEWILVEIPFKTEESQAEYDLMFKGNDYVTNPIEIDRLLIRPANKDFNQIFFWNNDSILQHNGHFIVKPKP